MEKDIGRIRKNDTTDIVIRVDDFGGRPGVTIREFVTGERYTGFTKSGTRISAEEFPKFKEMISSISVGDLVSDGSSEPSAKPAKQTLPKSFSKPKKEESEDFTEGEEFY